MAGKEGTPPEQMRDYIGKIESSGKYLLALINDILEMTRIESGKVTLEESETDPEELRTVLAKFLSGAPGHSG